MDVLPVTALRKEEVGIRVLLTRSLFGDGIPRRFVAPLNWHL